MLIAIAGAALCLAVPGRRAGAAPAASSSTPPPAAHHGLFGFRHKNGAVTKSRAPFAGAIIGNKRTHVYHLPGDKGNLPAAQNRVYFHSAAEATAAGYHAAGQHGSSVTGRHRPIGLHARAGSGSGKG
jgi:hypothetical protein